MDIGLILAGLVVVALLIVGVFFFISPFAGARAQRTSVSANLRNLVVAQRHQDVSGSGTRSNASKLAIAAAEETQLSRKRTTASSRMTLEKRLRYARWPITPLQFRFIQVLLAVCAFLPAYLYMTPFLQGVSFVLTFLLVDSLLDMFINRRFKLFDVDYPVMLLSYVSLLKTGMGVIGGLEAAAKGLDPGSLVRAEVELLVERLRLGLTEEQAINAFGEDIAHPELELFVQSLLLSRKVGGTLSSTLERLAKQVRKRQQFRDQAIAAVGMERSSLHVIAVIMSLLLIYIAFKSPDLMLPALTDPTGKTILQGGVGLVFLGFYWSRVVTKIKV